MMPNVYAYSFALNPEQFNASGSCNLSKLDMVDLIQTIDKIKPTGKKCTLKVFSHSYNIFGIMNGIGALKYAL